MEEEKEADQALLAAEAGEEKEKDPGFLKGRRIMLVEDNELNQEIARGTAGDGRGSGGTGK